MKLVRTIPALPVRDVQIALEHYVSALGFSVVHESDGLAVIQRDDAILHLWQASDEAWRDRAADEPVRSGAESFLAGTASCRIEAHGIDELFAEFDAAGVLHPGSTRVMATDYGSREFHAIDLDGNLLSFYRWV